MYFITFEHWGQLPHSQTSNRSVLTESRLQKEQGHASKYQRQKVGNQEGPWMRGEKQKCVNHEINIHYNPTCYLVEGVFGFRRHPEKRADFLLFRLVRNYARRCWEDTLKISFISNPPESGSRSLVASPLRSVLVFVENSEIILDYLRRFSHTSKEISTHFPVRLRIRHKRGESQISQPTFLSRVCPFSSSAPSPPVFWVCHLAWCWARRSRSRLRRVRPRLWSRLWP